MTTRSHQPKGEGTTLASERVDVVVWNEENDGEEGGEDMTPQHARRTKFNPSLEKKVKLATTS